MTLNINHAAILDKAQERSNILRQIEALFQTEGHTTLDRLQRAEVWLRDLYEVYRTLDVEGLSLLPDSIQSFLRSRYFAQLETVIGGNGALFAGLEAAMALFPREEWVPEPMHPYDKEADPAKAPSAPKYTGENLMEPQCDSNGQYFKINIRFLPEWDTATFPNGAWHAQYEGNINYGVGATPTEAFLHLEGRDE